MHKSNRCCRAVAEIGLEKISDGIDDRAGLWSRVVRGFVTEVMGIADGLGGLQAAPMRAAMSIAALGTSSRPHLLPFRFAQARQ
jgi:hypothetical protein